MKLITSVLIALVLLVNLVVAQPSLAGDDDQPTYETNPDYIAITQELNKLSKAKDTQAQFENYSPEEIQSRIAELEFQKYTLETGTNWGQCRNETGRTLAVYGPKPKKSPTSYENVLYFLGDGQTTQEQWDCAGVYLPNDVKIASSNSDEQGQELAGPVAVKIADGTQVVIKSNPETGAVEFSLPPAKVFKAGEANWFIPNVPQSVIATRIPSAPTGAAPSNEES